MQNRLVVFSLLAILCVATLPIAQAQTQPAHDEYVCPPCGCDRDDHVFDKPGTCPVCNMNLVRKGSAAAQPMNHNTPARNTVAILIFDGVQIIDYTGPWEVFGQGGFDVFTVAPGTSPITTVMGMRVTPQYTLENAPEADVLVIPGGDVTAVQQSPQVMKWIRDRSAGADRVLSVCNGAYILAATGLLDGLTATTFYDLIDGLPQVAPKLKVVRDKRFVDNGKFITTAGLSSGIDGSLHVISKVLGKGRAQMVALNMEYDWKPDSTYARANLADRSIRTLFGRRLHLPVPAGAEASVSSTAGTTRQWEVQWQVKGDTTPSDVMRVLSQNLTAHQWTERKGAGTHKRSWTFEDEGQKWNGVTEVHAAGPQLVTVRMTIDRAASR